MANDRIDQANRVMETDQASRVSREQDLLETDRGMEDHRDIGLDMAVRLTMDITTIITIHITDGVGTGRGSGEVPLRSVRSFRPYLTMTVMIFI